MYYRLKISEKDKIELVSDNSIKLLSRLFIIIAVIIVFIALKYYFKTGVDHKPSDFFSFFIPILLSVGLLFFIFGVIMPSQKSNFLPSKIIFDQTHRLIEFQGYSFGKTQKSYVPFNEISGFNIRQEKISGGSNNSYNYYVYFKKKDGACWDIFNSTSLKNAEDILASLQSHIDFSKEMDGKIKPILPSPLKKEQYQGKEMISWKNEFKTIQFISFLAVGIIGYVFFMMFKLFTSEFGGNRSWFVYIVFSIMGLVYCIVVFGTIRNLMINKGKSFGLAFGKQNLEYLEFSKGGNVVKSQKINLEEIETLVYHFTLNKDNTSLYFFPKNHKDLDEELHQDNLSFKEIIETLSKKRHLLKLEIQNVSAINFLQIEHYIQEKIREVSGFVVR